MKKLIMSAVSLFLALGGAATDSDGYRSRRGPDIRS